MIGLGKKALTTPISGEELMALGQAMSQPQARAHEPSLREKVGNTLYDAMTRLGGLGGVQNRVRGDAMSLVDLAPVLGDVVGVDEAVRDYHSGNYGSALAGLGLTAVGALPGVGDAVAGAARRGVNAIQEAIAPQARPDIDPRVLAVVREYGLSAAVAAGLITADEAAQLEATGEI